MRPKRWYCVFDMGRVVAVVEGQAAAYRITRGRRYYISRANRLAAEEFAAWWNYERSHWWWSSTTE